MLGAKTTGTAEDSEVIEEEEEEVMIADQEREEIGQKVVSIAGNRATSPEIAPSVPLHLFFST